MALLALATRLTMLHCMTWASESVKISRRHQEVVPLPQNTRFARNDGGAVRSPFLTSGAHPPSLTRAVPRPLALATQAICHGMKTKPAKKGQLLLNPRFPWGDANSFARVWGGDKAWDHSPGEQTAATITCEVLSLKLRGAKSGTSEARSNLGVPLRGGESP